jgi:hypothetical protein
MTAAPYDFFSDVEIIALSPNNLDVPCIVSHASLMGPAYPQAKIASARSRAIAAAAA